MAVLYQNLCYNKASYDEVGLYFNSEGLPIKMTGVLINKMNIA